MFDYTPFFSGAKGNVLVYENAQQAQIAEEKLFAYYEKGEGAYVFSCEKVDHSGERFKEKVIEAAVNGGRDNAYLKWLVTEVKFIAMLICSADRAVIEMWRALTRFAISKSRA